MEVHYIEVPLYYKSGIFLNNQRESSKPYCAYNVLTLIFLAEEGDIICLSDEEDTGENDYVQVLNSKTCNLDCGR